MGEFLLTAWTLGAMMTWIGLAIRHLVDASVEFRRGRAGERPTLPLGWPLTELPADLARAALWPFWLRRPW